MKYLVVMALAGCAYGEPYETPPKTCLESCGNAKSDVEAYRCVWHCNELAYDGGK